MKKKVKGVLEYSRKYLNIVKIVGIKEVEINNILYKMGKLKKNIKGNL